MKKSIRLLFLLFFVIQLVPAAAQSPLEWIDCPFENPVGIRIDCAYMTVPENRDDPQSRRIRLAVAVLHSSAQNPAPDPLVYLVGGPGGSIVKELPGVALLFRPFLAERDVILVDQRGAGASIPALTCPEIAESEMHLLIDPALTPEDALTITLESARACHDRLIAQGVDLSGYDSVNSAADFEELRLALGLEQWNLLSGSYGTRLAQTIARDFPGGVRSLILDSPVPVEEDLLTGNAGRLRHALDRVFAGCAANTLCSQAFPDLEARFYTLLTRLDQQPLVFRVFSPDVNQTITTELDDNLLVDAIFGLLYGRQSASLIPILIHEIEQGNTERAQSLANSWLWRSGGITTGMYISVQCAEEFPFSSEEMYRADMAAHPEFDTLFKSNGEYITSSFAGCEIWNVTPADVIESQPVLSELPAIIFSGQYDPITPPAYGEQIAQNLSNSFHYEFPGAGHGIVIPYDCGIEMALNFLRHPAEAPDSSCIERIGSIRYLLPPDFLAQRQMETELPPLIEVELSAFSAKVPLPDYWLQLDEDSFGDGEARIQFFTRAPGEVDALVKTYAEEVGLRPPRRKSSEQLSNGLNWSLYTILDEGRLNAIAIAVQEERSYWIVLSAPAIAFPEDILLAILAGFQLEGPS